jgi:hypothetical protein
MVFLQAVPHDGRNGEWMASEGVEGLRAHATCPLILLVRRLSIRAAAFRPH